MKLLLVYPPFCPPTVPPHSITHLASCVRHNSPLEVKCLDLNAKFHSARLRNVYGLMPKAGRNRAAYAGMLERYLSSAGKVHRLNNLAMASGQEPEMFGQLLGGIIAEKPDAAGFSVVYNSQIFYSLALIRALEARGIKCLAGGPAAPKLAAAGVQVLKDGHELLSALGFPGKTGEEYSPDFSCYQRGDYLSREMVLPLRSSFGCSWASCAFCTHHSDIRYREIPAPEIVRAATANRARNIFFIDDNVTATRLTDLADALGPLKVRWACQTRPTEDLLGLFPKLRQSGCVSVSFGVESGSQAMLDAMHKGTQADTAGKVLAESHASGIRNLVFVMFGFPGETERTFLETMEFLRANRRSIDVVSASVFGLQRGSAVWLRPGDFGVRGITARDTPLGETVSYEVERGLSQAQAQTLKEAHIAELRSMNSLPRAVAVLKEQSLFF